METNKKVILSTNQDYFRINQISNLNYDNFLEKFENTCIYDILIKKIEIARTINDDNYSEYIRKYNEHIDEINICDEEIKRMLYIN